MPKLLLPALFLTLGLLSAYRWRREGPGADGHGAIPVRLVVSCILIAAISVPLIFRMVPHNGVYGFRTSLTGTSQAVWYQADALTGWALPDGAISSAIGLTMLPTTANRWLLLVTFLAPVLCAVAAWFMYLYRLA